MATMNPEEFVEQHGSRIPTLCQDLCQNYQDDYQLWFDAGSPKHGPLYARVQADAAAIKQNHCKCIFT